jgi:hypothetical protein
MIGLALPLFLALLGACAQTREPRRAAKLASTEPPDSVVRAIPTTDLTSYTVFDSATYDVDGDGVAERADLSAIVGRSESGWEWDDNNQWLVAVRDGADAYPLLRESLPGSAAFWIVRTDSIGPPAILVQTSLLTMTGAGTRLEKFVFDREKGGFVRTGSVEAWGPAEYRGPPDDDVLPATPYRGTIERESDDSASRGTSAHRPDALRPAPAPRP